MTNTYTPAFRNSGGDIITGFAGIYGNPADAQWSVDMLNQDIPANSTNPVFVAVHNGLQWLPYHQDMAVAA